MKRNRIFAMLVLLSFSALLNATWGWWTKDWIGLEVMEEISTPQAEAVEADPIDDGGSTARKQPEQTPRKNDPYPGRIRLEMEPGEVQLLQSLRSMKEALEERERRLLLREKAVAEVEKEADKRLKELEAMLAKVQQRLQEEESIKSKKIKRLTAVYASMKPEKSAQVIERMDLDTVIKIFSRMDEKKVGKIMSFLPPEKAVLITEGLTKKARSN